MGRTDGRADFSVRQAPRLPHGRENLVTQCSLRRAITISPRGYPGIPAGFQVGLNRAARPSVDADRSMVPFRQPRNLRHAHPRALCRGPRHQRDEPRSTDYTLRPFAGYRSVTESNEVSARLLQSSRNCFGIGISISWPIAGRGRRATDPQSNLEDIERIQLAHVRLGAEPAPAPSGEGANRHWLVSTDPNRNARSAYNQLTEPQRAYRIWCSWHTVNSGYPSG
jgi:hypothetical protein